MSRKHHKSKYKSNKAKTKVGSYTKVENKEEKGYQKVTSSNSKTSTNKTKTIAKYAPCHKITEIYDNFFLMGRSSESLFVRAYNPDIIVPLAGTSDDLYKQGFKGEFYYYPIPDYGTLPQEVLNKLVLKIVASITCGAKVGMYCLGGHGRTGYVAACVLGVLGIQDPINYLWTRYCTKAIESREQLKSITDYLQRDDLYKKYKDEINDFDLLKYWNYGTYYSGYNNYDKYNNDSTTPKTTNSNDKLFKNSNYLYGWGFDDEYDDYDYGYTVSKDNKISSLVDYSYQHAIEETNNTKTYEQWEELFNSSQEDEEDYSEAIDEGRVLSPSEIKLLKDDPMWSCEDALENLQGAQLQEAFNYLRDVYGVG